MSQSDALLLKSEVLWAFGWAPSAVPPDELVARASSGGFDRTHSTIMTARYVDQLMLTYVGNFNITATRRLMQQTTMRHFASHETLLQELALKGGKSVLPYITDANRANAELFRRMCNSPPCESVISSLFVTWFQVCAKPRIAKFAERMYCLLRCSSILIRFSNMCF